ncbi:MAG: hypothetical protein ACE5G2_01465 [Candidatus Krumholzibacteriia bacterium]
MPEGEAAILFVMAATAESGSGGIRSAQFRIEITDPEGWVVWYRPPAHAVSIGDPVDRVPLFPNESGVRVSFPQCQPHAFVNRTDLGTLAVYNQSGRPTYLVVRAPHDASVVGESLSVRGCGRVA